MIKPNQWSVKFYVGILSFFLVLFLTNTNGFCSEGNAANTSPAVLSAVANAILNWDGKTPGDMFQKVKEANPDKNAIDSIRELNAVLADGGLSADITSQTDQLKAKQNQAQEAVRTRVTEVRETMLRDYIRKNPEKARSLYGFGDIGSWSTGGKADASMDIDWTILGVDKNVTADARDAYVEQLVNDLDKNESGLTLQDFDVVVTAEGHEKAAGVFESEGGIDWAKRNMKSFTVVQPDGYIRTYNLEKKIVIEKNGRRRLLAPGEVISDSGGRVVTHIVGDPVGEMAMASQMAEIRKATTEGGDYGSLFDEGGFLRTDVFDNPNTADYANKLWDKYGDLLNLANVDYYKSRAHTAAGGALDMGKHLNEEVLTKKFEPEARMRKTLKYLYRADNITRKGDPQLRKAIDADPLLSDPAYKKAIELAYEVTQHPETVGEVLKRNYGNTPDAALQELGNRSKTAILRMAEVSYQVEMDRIIMDIPTAEGRKVALDKLTHDFNIIAEEGGDYSDLARTTLDSISKVMDVNDTGAIESMKKNWSTLEQIREQDAGLGKQTLDYLGQTELGRKMLESGGKFLDWGSKPVFEKAKGKFRSGAVDFISDMVDSTRAKGMVVVDIAGSLSMWVEVLNSVRDSESDADLAYALGKTLITNTFFGMILSTGYAGIVQGDNEALAKAVMYMLVPEMALADLVKSLGVSSIHLGSQMLFETQMEALYVISTCGEDGEMTELFEMGAPNKETVLELIDDFLQPGGYVLAEEMISSAKSKLTDAGKGVNALMKTGVVKAIEATVIKGNPLLFTKDGGVMNACSKIRKTTEELEYLATSFGITIITDAHINGDWAQDLDKGQTKAINTLLESRFAYRTEAKNAFASAIIRTFNERCRAENQLDEGKEKAFELLEKCQSLFKRLGIEKEGMLALDAKGAPYNIISAWLATDKEKQRTAMIALQKFIDTYQTVEEARTAAETLAARILGTQRKLRPRPLTGSLPLTTDPDRDMQIARAYLQELATVGEKSQKSLRFLKKDELEGEYDQSALRTLYAYRVRMVYWRSYAKAAQMAKDLHWASEIYDLLMLDGEYNEAYKEIDLLEEKEDVLLEEYKKHYDLDGEFSVELQAPKEVTSGESVQLKILLTYSKDGEQKELPPEIISQITYVWMAGASELGTQAAASKSFRLDTIGEHEFSVEAQRQTKKAGKVVQETIGEASITVTVIAEEITAEEKEKIEKEKLEKEKQEKEQGEKLADSIAQMKKDHDWKALVKLLAKETKNKDQKPDVQLKRLGDINQALKDLKWKTQIWLVKYKEYLTKLLSMNDSAWSDIYQEMEIRRDHVQNKCHKDCVDCQDKCSKQAFKYYDDCVGVLKKQHEAEGDRLRASLKALPPIVEKLDSGSYQYEKWFKEVEALAKKHQLPNPYPDPVVTSIKYESKCLDEEIDEEETEGQLEALDVMLNGPTAVIEVGMLANLTVAVSGGVPPYKYSWTGTNGYSSSASFTPASIGDWAVSVQVADSEGNTGSDNFLVRVAAGKIKMQGLKGDVFYGETTALNAWGMGLEEKKIEAPKIEEPEDVDYEPIDCVNNPNNPFCVDVSSTSVIDYTGEYRGNETDWEKIEAEGASSGTIYFPDPDSEGYVDGYHMPNPLSEFEDDDVPQDEEEEEKSEYQVIWQSEPAVTFDPPTCTDGLTKITYDRMGEVKVWCDLLKEIDGVFQTVGECEQEKVMVKPPSFSISYDPENGSAPIGQTVRATIKAKPVVAAKLIDYRWLDPATSNRMELDKNGRRIEFTVNDLNPIKLKVLARVPVHGDDIAEIESSYTGVGFTLNAWMVQPPNLVRTWDAKKGGLKTLKKTQRATGELITLKAEVQGANVPDTVRFQWSVNEGTTISNPISQTPTVSRGSAGSIIAKVNARDKNNRSLGSAEVSVTVIQVIPDPTVKKDANQAADKAKKEKAARAKKAQLAKKVISESQKDIKRGKFDDVISKSEDALKQDPGNEEIKAHIVQVKKEKEKIDQGLKKVDQLIKSSDFQQAQENLIPLKNKASYYPPVQEMEETLRVNWQAHIAKVNAAMGDVRVKSQRRDYKESLAAIDVARNTLKLAPSELKTLADQESYLKPLVAKKEKAKESFAASKEKLAANDFAGCIKAYLVGYKLTPNMWNINTDKTINKAEEVYRQAVAKQKELDQYLKVAKGAMTMPAYPQRIKDFERGLEQCKAIRALQPNNVEVAGIEAAIKEKMQQAGLSDVSGGNLGEAKAGKGISRPSGEPVSTNSGTAGITLSKGVFEPNEKIKFDFTVDSEQNAWVGMYKIDTKHDYSASNVTWQDFYKKASGSLEFTAPGKEGAYEFRIYERSERKEIATIKFKVEVDQGAASLGLPKTVFEPNEKFKLQFSATALQNAWVGMYKPEAKHDYSASNITWQDFHKKASGALEFTAPMAEGIYEFRIFERSNRQELVTISFNVIVDEDAASLTLSKTVFEPSEKVNLEFTATALQNAWVGMYKLETKHDYSAPNMAWQDFHKKANGTLEFTVPSLEGDYEFRTYERSNRKEIATLKFSVVVDKEAASLTLPKTVFEPNEKFHLQFTATALQNAWVGMYKLETNHDYSAPNLTWQNFNKQASGSLEFTAPKNEGVYEFRMYERSNRKEIAMIKFNVVVDKDAASLTLPKKVFQPNEKFKLQFTATELQNAWVGMYKLETKHDYSAPNIGWQDFHRKASGTLEFTAPSTEGAYEFRTYERSNRKEVAVISFSVKK